MKEDTPWNSQEVLTRPLGTYIVAESAEDKGVLSRCP